MRRDLHAMEIIYYLGWQELGRTQVPQLEAVRYYEGRGLRETGRCV